VRKLVAEPLFSDRGPQDYDASSVAGSGVEAVSGTLGHSIPFALVPRPPEHPGYVPPILFRACYSNTVRTAVYVKRKRTRSTYSKCGSSAFVGGAHRLQSRLDL